MKAIVSGATGFVGKWLVEELIKSQYEVMAFVHNMNKVPEAWKRKLKLVECKLSELSTLRVSADHENDYDVFFHLAWDGTSGIRKSNIDLQLNNVKYSCDAMILAQKLGCKKFVYAGSIMEYEAMGFIPQDGSQPGGGYIYSSAKLAADFMLKTLAAQISIEYYNVIISNIYGAGEISERFLNSIIRKMIKGVSIDLTHGNQMYDFIYVTDAVRAIVRVSENGKAFSSYYIGNSKVRPLREFVLDMKKILKSESALNFGKIPFNGAILDYTKFNTAKLEEELNIIPEISFKMGVEFTKDWMEKTNDK